MRKAPISTAAADQVRMKAGDCIDHQANSDLKRETPINGRLKAETTDTTLSTLKTAGNRDAAAAPQRAIPNANRIADAAHRPLWVCQFDTNLTIAVGEVKPKTPTPAAKIETDITISSLKFISYYPGFARSPAKKHGIKVALNCRSTACVAQQKPGLSIQS
jgi:hypothetical protein